jgi:hypothetical protein
MSSYSPLPASGHHVSWTTWDDQHVARVDLAWENEGWTANCQLSRERAQVVVRLSATWMVQQFIVFRDLDEPDLWLATDGHGRWGEMNGAHRTELDGCIDVDIVGIPVTNVIPIRRLPLHVGHGAQQNTIAVDLDTLGVTVVPQTYTKTGETTWRYRSLATGRDVDVAVDQFGFVLDEPEAFRRSTP